MAEFSNRPRPVPVTQMPQFPSTAALSDLYLKEGDIQAQSAREIGQIQARTAQNVGTGISEGLEAAIQHYQEAPQRAEEALEREQNRAWKEEVNAQARLGWDRAATTFEQGQTTYGQRQTEFEQQQEDRLAGLATTEQEQAAKDLTAKQKAFGQAAWMAMSQSPGKITPQMQEAVTQQAEASGILLPPSLAATADWNSPQAFRALMSLYQQNTPVSDQPDGVSEMIEWGQLHDPTEEDTTAPGSTMTASQRFMQSNFYNAEDVLDPQGNILLEKDKLHALVADLHTQTIPAIKTAEYPAGISLRELIDFGDLSAQDFETVKTQAQALDEGRMLALDIQKRENLVGQTLNRVDVIRARRGDPVRYDLRDEIRRNKAIEDHNRQLNSGPRQRLFATMDSVQQTIELVNELAVELEQGDFSIWNKGIAWSEREFNLGLAESKASEDYAITATKYRTAVITLQELYAYLMSGTNAPLEIGFELSMAALDENMSMERMHAATNVVAKEISYRYNAFMNLVPQMFDYKDTVHRREREAPWTDPLQAAVHNEIEIGSVEYFPWASIQQFLREQALWDEETIQGYDKGGQYMTYIGPQENTPMQWKIATAEEMGDPTAAGNLVGRNIRDWIDKAHGSNITIAGLTIPPSERKKDP
jgi:hypothetical protein